MHTVLINALFANIIIRLPNRVLVVLRLPAKPVRRPSSSRQTGTLVSASVTARPIHHYLCPLAIDLCRV